MHVVSSQRLVDELCDERRFNKRVHGPLQQIRAFAGDGLFTAYNSEPNWAKAHRLLMPAFGPLGVRSMFDRMVDIAHQMFVKWERFGASAVIDVADNMTRLTLDTIALCAFDYRFNSFYQNEMHPFVGGDGRCARGGRPARAPPRRACQPDGRHGAASTRPTRRAGQGRRAADRRAPQDPDGASQATTCST